MTSNRISIFGAIGQAGITADSVRYQLAQMDTSRAVIVELNSDGGEVSEGVAIYNLLRAWRAGVDVEIVGWCLSIATVIAMAGRKRRAHATALMMVHAPWTSNTGNAGAMRQTADLLDQVSATLRTAYARTGQPEAQINAWLDGADHWFTADQALKFGLIDEIITEGALAAAPVNVFAARHPVPIALQPRMNMTANSAATNQPAPSGQSPTDVDAIRAAGIQAEARRRAEIRAAFGPMRDRFSATPAVFTSLLDACENDINCTPQAAGLKLLAALGRETTPLAAIASGWCGNELGAVSTGGDTRISEFKAAAQDVLLQRGGIQVSEPHPAARDLARMSFAGMCEKLLSMRGASVRDKSGAEVISAALSTSDLPGLLGDTAGRALRAGYMEAAGGHALWTAEREVSDFKTQTLLNLSEAPGLEEVRELAEYKHGSLSESSSTFTLSTFGKIIRISRQALVNDDLGAFTSLPKAYGAAARRLEADKVYELLTSNPTLGDGVALFHADHANLGSAAALSIASLGAARAAMRKQRGIGGLGFIDLQPRYLVVPVALETTAEQLLASLVDPAKSNDTPNLEFIRRLTLVADPRLDVSSATAWYLAADPKQTEGIVRAYLTGEQRPHLEEQQEFKVDAMSFKARLDFCAGVVDFRALFKNPGA